MTAQSILQRHGRTVLLDFALLAGIFLMPSLSHLLAMPIYLLEPMRIAVLIALLFSHRANAWLVAITLPLASFLISGHPEPVKAVLMGIEFSVLIATYAALRHTLRLPTIAAIGAAIVAGKLVYYGSKAAVLSVGWLGGALMSTPWTLQLATAAGTAIAFGLIENARRT
jgi:hypothetical protein